MCVKRFSQEERIDFNEMFSPINSFGTKRVILVIAAQQKFKILQCDIKTLFPHGDIDKDIYMQPPDLIIDSDFICKLK